MTWCCAQRVHRWSPFFIRPTLCTTIPWYHMVLCPYHGTMVLPWHLTRHYHAVPPWYVPWYYTWTLARYVRTYTCTYHIWYLGTYTGTMDGTYDARMDVRTYVRTYVRTCHVAHTTGRWAAFLLLLLLLLLACLRVCLCSKRALQWVGRAWRFTKTQTWWRLHGDREGGGHHTT